MFYFLVHKDGVRTPETGLVNAGAEPLFAFYLVEQIYEKLTIDGVNSAHYTVNFGSVIDTMLFKCKQERQAALSHHMPHFLRIKVVR